jgi:hypothetical protein
LISVEEVIPGSVLTPSSILAGVEVRGIRSRLTVSPYAVPTAEFGEKHESAH